MGEIMRDHSFKPTSMDQLEDPAFLAYVKGRYPDRIKPDPQDFDQKANPTTDAECAYQYRLAMASKLLRLYGEWKASLS
jgi:hypothetical protein